MVITVEKREEERLRAAYERAKEIFSKEFGLPKKEMPPLHIVLNLENPRYVFADNEIQVPPNDHDLGNTLGEELGHYVRERLAGEIGKGAEKKREHITHEFFGMLGRDILFRGLPATERQQLFPQGVELYTVERGKRDVQQMKESKNAIKSASRIERALYEQSMTSFNQSYDKALQEKNAQLVNAYLGELPNYKKQSGKHAKKVALEFVGGEEAFNQAVKTRIGITHHSRGYKYGSMVDLDKVDPKTLFSLPDQEVRKHFFRPDQHYAVAQRSPLATTKPSNLETKIGAVVIGLMSITLLGMLFSKPLTGAAIIGLSQGQQLFTSVISLLLLGVLYLHPS
ncbi:MAG: hypothetical protein Q7R56_02290 [Nanoarchaeota archaeon]|nr:hypothetical protein [Nanoarchaeota archaeon]